MGETLASYVDFEVHTPVIPLCGMTVPSQEGIIALAFGERNVRFIAFTLIHAR